MAQELTSHQYVAVRAAVWTFIIASALAAVALLLPAFELETRHLGGKRTEVSLLTAARDRTYAARFVVAYRASHTDKIGPAVVAAIAPRTKGSLRSVLGDAGDAMSTLDGVSAADARTLGTVIAAVVYSFLALEILAIGLLFGPAVGDGTLRARRVAPALLLAAIGAAAGVAIHMVAREVVFQANDYAGIHVLNAAIGAYLLPIATLAALGAGIAMLVIALRARRKP